jgi:hypothetical protein
LLNVLENNHQCVPFGLLITNINLLLLLIFFFIIGHFYIYFKWYKVPTMLLEKVSIHTEILFVHCYKFFFYYYLFFFCVCWKLYIRIYIIVLLYKSLPRWSQFLFLKHIFLFSFLFQFLVQATQKKNLFRFSSPPFPLFTIQFTIFYFQSINTTFNKFQWGSVLLVE